jgi:membrane protein DedA with SNARE-associated domain
MQEWLAQTIHNYPVLVYGIIIFVSFVEGPILAMLSGVFVKVGLLYLIPVYFALMFGDLIGDCFWYWIGRRFGHHFISRFGRFFSVSEHNVRHVEHIFHKFSTRILLISKVTMGFGFALVTLITAGIVKIPFGKYIQLNVLGQFVWTGFLIAIGYFLGNFYLKFNNILGVVSTIGLMIIIFLLLVGYGRYLKNRFSQIH